MSKVTVVGGGPSGMIAAIAAAENGHEVTLVEKNEKLGKKLFITGKGRCNITNASDMDNLFSNVVSNPKFLYSAFYSFDNNAIVEFLNKNGLPTKVERGNRVFPVSDHSSDVIAALRRALDKCHVTVRLNTSVSGIITKDGGVNGVRLKGGEELKSSAVIVATGGFSYQTTGSTGDGYRFAKETGHKLTPVRPSLVPFCTKEDYVTRLQGLSLRNINIKIFDDTKSKSGGRKILFDAFGEMLFTHFGVSGPLILSASAVLKLPDTHFNLPMEIDLKPALGAEQVDERLIRDFKDAANKQYKNSLTHLFPAKMIPVMVELSGIDPDKKANEITKAERKRLAELIKAFPLTLNGLRDYNEAIITKGGVSVKDVNPSTMESKIINGLYFCGEVLDLDAQTGGYNLQIAWSTGHLAGNSIR